MASKKELLLNASKWVEVCKRELEGTRVGAIFIFFNMDSIGQGSAVCGGTVNKEAIKAELHSILKKLGDDNLIINPFEKN